MYIIHCIIENVILDNNNLLNFKKSLFKIKKLMSMLGELLCT